ncbi:hypothetical protein PanWU01x14_010610 [Parasponia andersonii]|uniref:Uncharacterized protein n=1 Tax=Parasponia andersonii TaxID=3476 RepID=A0A2P5E2R2_PARAD|nr:hypothetical protein PanWU01x14_010610 [Parasponia andersonii]
MEPEPEIECILVAGTIIGETTSAIPAGVGPTTPLVANSKVQTAAPNGHNDSVHIPVLTTIVDIDPMEMRQGEAPLIAAAPIISPVEKKCQGFGNPDMLTAQSEGHPQI